MDAVAALYQNGRTLGQSLAALKAALHHRGVCTPYVLPPLLPLSAAEQEFLRNEMSLFAIAELTDEARSRPHHGRPGRHRAGGLPAGVARNPAARDAVFQCCSAMRECSNASKACLKSNDSMLPTRLVSLPEWEKLERVHEPLIVDCAALNGTTISPGEISAACGKAGYIFIEQSHSRRPKTAKSQAW